MHRSPRALLLLCLLVTLPACKDQPPKPTAPGNTARSPSRTTPARAHLPPEETPFALYARYCALCHAADGSGHAADHASSLRSQSLLATASDAYLFQAIAHGRPGTPMSAWSRDKGGPLSDKDIRALITYLRSLRPGVEPVPVDHLVVKGDAKAGQRVYAQHCVTCHGEGGKGGRGVVLGHPGFLATASDGFIRHAIEHGRDGTPMPAFGARLSSKQLDDVTAYIRGLSPQGVRPPPVVVEPLPTIAQAVINPQGPAPRFSPLREGRYVPVEEVKAALDAGARMVLLDARPTSDWLRSHLPGALPVPFYEPEKFQESLPRDGTWIISYCACPHAASGKVMDSLRAAGFPNTAVLDEGILVWEQRGYPMAMGSEKTAGDEKKRALTEH
jgi:mono/diheme cytochrome c family protein/rhodanese-related sulfurtransferase